MSLSKTPPAKRLKQSSLDDFFPTQSALISSDTPVSGTFANAAENLESIKKLKLDGINKCKCNKTVIKIEDGSQNESKASEGNCNVGAGIDFADKATLHDTGCSDPNRPRRVQISSSFDCNHDVSLLIEGCEASNICKSDEAAQKVEYSSDSNAKRSEGDFRSQFVQHNVRLETTEMNLFDFAGDLNCDDDEDSVKRGRTQKETQKMAKGLPGISRQMPDNKGNTNRLKKLKSSPSQTPLHRLPVDLNQVPGDVPPNMARFPCDVVWRTAAMEESPDHTLLVKGPFDVNRSSPCEAQPTEVVERWDKLHVKMPYSQHSKYVEVDGREVPRWDVIQRALLGAIHSFNDLKEAILSYNGGYSWGLEELEDAIEEMTFSDRSAFFSTLLPGIINLALNLPTICTRPPPLLVKGHSHSVTLSQRQVASLLANAFLCTYPRRNTSTRKSQYASYPTINFHTLFNRCDNHKRRICRKEKIKCLLNYFRRITGEMPIGNLTFSRIRLRCRVGWEESMAKFKNAFITSKGLIEDEGHGMLMVDFANRRIGGGVLHDGCVQEEILFVIYPELIVSRLFTEALDDNEALLMTGPERFNEYRGYSDDFRWGGNVVDVRERDGWGRRYTQVVGLDALAYYGKQQHWEQFSAEKVTRELMKSFCGFQTPGFPRSAVATGNWGCGAFGGDARLKFLIQWMAASRAGRPLMYFTFGDHKLMCQLRAIQSLVAQQDVTIGKWPQNSSKAYHT
ncbi:poly(ADP-ribose) glycohydrolase-like [Tropilaelaps mercedesae]|uniref:poly(ADP-ribose) glycohydrolase n=1 Tax=Tropilaelaps mercedesae TaxID=418985 RepID=A0A1V9XSX5_9ACAR|nr:poly(ADP-ribose) glycohydrolase-like [Tropilaelaps mercedesae]